MRIAILGATSQIAKDLIVSFFADEDKHLHLFARRPDEVTKWLAAYIVRDFLHPFDFYQLVSALLAAPPANAAVDCYSRAPIDKPTLLAAMQEKFGLQYEITEASASVNATGSKPHYYSLNTRAAGFGYQPALTSLEGILKEAKAIIMHGPFC